MLQSGRQSVRLSVRTSVCLSVCYKCMIAPSAGPVELPSAAHTVSPRDTLHRFKSFYLPSW